MRFYFKILAALVSLLTCLASTTALAQFYVGPAASATGGAGRASVDPSEAVFLNPASLAHLQRYYFNASYGQGTHPVDADYNNFGVALSDGSSGNLVPGAITYVKRRSDYKGGIVATEQDIQVAIGAFLVKGLSLGFAAHRLLYQPNYGDEITQNNAHVGVLYTPIEWFGLGVVGYDLFPEGDSLDARARLVPKAAIGANFLLGDLFHFRLDAVRAAKFNTDNRVDVGLGMETFFREDFAFRLGCLWKESTDQTYLTTGIGILGPRLSFDYSYQRDVRINEGGRHMIDLWLPL